MTLPAFLMSGYRICLRRERPKSATRFVCSHASHASVPAPVNAIDRVPPIFFVLGGPGSGKGTQCNLLKRDYDVRQLCVGDLLRREAATGSALGRSVADIMQRGGIVPGEVTMGLLRDELTRLHGLCRGVLIDGFPRAMDQAKEFENMITDCESVLYFHCDKDVMVERLLSRGKTSGRADDVEDVVKKRLKTFADQTLPVIEYFRERGLVKEIESGKGTPEEVYETTRSVFRDAYVRL